MELSLYTDLFLSESREQISLVNQLLLAWEKAAVGEEEMEQMFRAVHTLKGNAAAMGYQAVSGVAHGFEQMLEAVRSGERDADEELLGVLFAAVDALEKGVESSVAASEPDAATAVEAEDPAQAPAAGSLIRVSQERIDSLVDRAGELVIARDRLQRVAGDDADPELAEAVAQLSRLIAEMREEVLRVRLVPAWHVFNRFPRLVRDTARDLGKRVSLEVSGGSAEFDRSVVDVLGEIVVHLVRNALDHGLESPEERRAADKQEVGTLRLSAGQQRGWAVVRIADDGRGIRREKVVERAVRAGLLSEDAGVGLSDEELFRLIAGAGFSTAEAVTDVSGRGVGLDVVVSRVRAMGGSVEWTSRPGEGTTFTLRLPLTLAITRALLVRGAGETYVIPFLSIAATTEVPRSEIAEGEAEPTVSWRGDRIPLLRLRSVLGAAPEEEPWVPLVVLEEEDRHLALAVDGFAGQQEVVLKEFDEVRGAAPIFAGATILADGRPALILDVRRLFAAPAAEPLATAG